MGFADKVKAFAEKTAQQLGEARDGIDAEVFTSIVEGSPITGAPGQPIGSTGKLHDSWQQEKDGDDTVTYSDSKAAQPVEENWSNVTFKNHGPHSLALTVGGFGRIVEAVVRSVAGD